MKSVFKVVLLFFAGGLLYWCIEMLFRGRSHWTMMVVGGICFLICGGLNEFFLFQMPLLLQGIWCSILITLIEFASGCILNLWLHLNIWDYSNLPLNLFGQICLPFSLLWILVGIFAVVLDDYLRYWFFHEEKPKYKVL